MKKTNIIIIAVVAIALLLGAWFFMSNKKSSDISQQAMPASEGKDGNGMKEGLLSLLQGTSGVKCTVEDSGRSYTVTAKGERVRIDGIDYYSVQSGDSSPKKGTMINDGEWAYMWSGNEGMKFNLKDMQGDTSADKNLGQDTSDWKDWVKAKEISNAKYDCNPTVATDSDFNPPSDVKFQDLGELMKSFQQQAPINPEVPINPDQYQIPKHLQAPQ